MMIAVGGCIGICCNLCPSKPFLISSSGSNVRFCSICFLRSSSPWYATLLIILEVLRIRRVSGSSATWVNFPFCFSKSSWYLTWLWSFVFSASLLLSGVSATAVALAWGQCLKHLIVCIVWKFQLWKL